MSLEVVEIRQALEHWTAWLYLSIVCVQKYFGLWKSLPVTSPFVHALDWMNFLETMFDDSKTAGSFQLSKTKCGYFINHGLAPHFKDLLLEDVKACPFFVVSFDESLNEFIKKEQMDLQIRY